MKITVRDVPPRAAWTLEQAGIEFKQADKQEQPRLQEVA